MPFDAAQTPAPTLRPGQVLFRGRVEIGNLDVYNRAVAREAVEAAPADLSGLTDGELRGLRSKCLLLAGNRVDDLLDAVLSRVCAEQAARGFDTRGVRVAS